MKQEQPSHHINFKTLTNKELDDLSKKWESEAKIFEKRLDKYLSNPNPNSEKAARLWNVGASLWRRLKILENFIWKNRKEIRKRI